MMKLLLLVYFFTIKTCLTSNKVAIMKQQRQLTSQSDYSHPCVRECISGASMVCYYTLIVDWYTSMSVQCGDCPYNVTACTNPGCIVGGGIVRPVISANRRIPGPAISVCENDTVIVDVTNALDNELLVIHWHGIHQVGSPYMDGGPYVTQCPLTPGDSFRYQFLASPHGTHMWHGHIGYQDSSGLFGPFIVRRQEPDYINSLYDYDLPEHTVTVWHWYNHADRSVLPAVLHTGQEMMGYGLLINGHGAFGKFPSKTNGSDYILTPRAKFIVNQRMKHRFRIIANSAIYCPVQVSVDNHTLLVISGDTDSFQPLPVDSLMVNAGERYSFVIEANQTVGCYWMRFRGLGHCGEMMSRVHAEAVVCYNGTVSEPAEETTYNQGKRFGRMLNPVAEEDYSNVEQIPVSYLTGLEVENYSYNGPPNVTIYLELNAKYYGEADGPGPWPQFNNISFEFPPFSMLTQPEMLSDSVVCDDVPDSRHCIGTFCSCTITKKVPLNALVEIVMVDVGVIQHQYHPIHLHGHKFYVVAEANPTGNISLDYVKDLNEKNLIPKKLFNAPAKDTVSVPNNGFTIIRFKAENPGFWLFHCHITQHLVLGMAMVLQVGELSEMSETPPNFPTCGSSLYDPIAQKLHSSQSNVQQSRLLSFILFSLLIGVICVYV